MAKKKTTDSKQTREKIIKAAIKCFGDHGVAETKMAQIALEAGVEPPHIHYYYPNSESLFKEVIDYTLKDLNNIAVANIEKSGSDPIKEIEKYAETYFIWVKKNPRFATIWLYFYHISSYNPNFVALNKNIREVGRDRISLLLYRGLEMSKVKIKKGWTVQQLAYAIQGIITGHAVMAASEGQVEMKNVSENALKIIRELIN